VVIGWLCVDAPGAMPPLVCASAYVAQIAQVATAATAPIILIALLFFTIPPSSLFPDLPILPRRATGGEATKRDVTSRLLFARLIKLYSAMTQETHEYKTHF
jgi:hypothetical protein